MTTRGKLKSDVKWAETYDTLPDQACSLTYADAAKLLRVVDALEHLAYPDPPVDCDPCQYELVALAGADDALAALDEPVQGGEDG